MKKIFCFDMDMTLLDHHTFEIPESAMTSLNQLREAGHIIVVASGRDMENTFSKHLAERVDPDAIVHTNGLKVTVKDEKIYESFMDPELVKALLDYGENHNICIGYNLGNIAYYVHHETVIQREIHDFGKCEREFGDPRELTKVKLHALAMFGTTENAKELEREFPMFKLPMFSGNVGADIIDKNVSKAVGIEALLKYYGMQWDDVVAFGDSMNDIEMVSKAGLGIAMGNAVEELKQKADFVTKAVDQDGIRYGLQHYGFL